VVIFVLKKLKKMQLLKNSKRRYGCVFTLQ
jgi:hypothetical protein